MNSAGGLRAPSGAARQQRKAAAERCAPGAEPRSGGGGEDYSSRRALRPHPAAPKAALCRAAGGGAGARACPALRWEPRGSAFPCSVSTRPLRREPPTLLITPPNDLAVHEASWGSAPGCPVPPSAGSRAGTPRNAGTPPAPPSAPRAPTSQNAGRSAAQCRPL